MNSPTPTAPTIPASTVDPFNQEASDWLADFAHFYSNSTIKSVTADFEMLLAISAKLKRYEQLTKSSSSQSL